MAWLGSAFSINLSQAPSVLAALLVRGYSPNPMLGVTVLTGFFYCLLQVVPLPGVVGSFSALILRSLVQP